MAATGSSWSEQTGWQSAGDTRPGSWGHVDLDPTAVQLNEALDQRQPKTGRRQFPAVQAVPSDRGSVRRNAACPLANAQQQFVRQSFGLHANDAAGRGELDRIRNQVEQGLFEAPLVGFDKTDSSRAGYVDFNRAAARPLVHQGRDAVQQIVNIHRAALQFEITGLDRCQIDRIADQRQQLMRAVENQSAIFALT